MIARVGSSISHKVFAGVSAIVLATGVVGFTGFYGLNESNRRLVDVYEQELVTIEALDDAKSALYRIRGDALEYLLADRPTTRERLKAEINEQQRRIALRFQQYRSTRLSSAEGRLLSTLEDASNAYIGMIEREVLPVVDFGDSADAERMARGNAVEVFREAREAANKLMDYAVARAGKRIRNSEEDHEKARGLMTTSFVIAIIAGMVIVVALHRTVSRPIKEMTRAMTDISQRDWAVAIPAIGRRDEIGEMATAVTIFKANGAENELMESQLFHLATHDPLTDLPNRRVFQEELEKALTSRSPSQTVNVLYLDLDGFKSVNDTLGHPMGDALLQEVANRLSESMKSSGMVARFGGDEFAIVTRNDPTAVAATLLEAVSRRFDIDGFQIAIGTSIGIAVAPRDGADPEELLRRADLALYDAKDAGRGTFKFFQPELESLSHERRTLELELRDALVRGEFELEYQPIINLARREITTAEALVRWRHPERGLIAPADFIPLAEETRLIQPLGQWILREACRVAAGWPRDIRVAVNVSPIQFMDANLVQSVVSALASSELAPNRLELEITETAIMQQTEMTVTTLRQLRSLGVRIALDDFGTGYSSLSYLHTFSFDKIKIDRSFVQGLSTNQDMAEIFRAIAGIGASLGITTTAEGVETSVQLETVLAHGCVEGQGYYFSCPKSAIDLSPLLETGDLGRVDKPDPKTDRCDLNEAENAGRQLAVACRDVA